MSDEPCLIGIDGGGTSTTAWIADETGNPLGKGIAGPSNAKAVGIEAALQALDSAIARAFQEAGREPRTVEVACLGLAGFDRPDDRILLEAWSSRTERARRLVLVNDGHLVIAAGTPDGWGLGVIAGTGSIAVGRDANGRTARSGGWGHLIGDEGSAYLAVIDGLRRVARHVDGREPIPQGAEELTEELCRALGVADPSAIVSAIYAPGVDRTRIASFAPAVTAAAARGSEAARQILRASGEELAKAVHAVAVTLWGSHPRRAPLPLALAGSFLLSSSLVADRLVQALDELGTPVEARRVPDPAAGAITLARRALIA